MHLDDTNIDVALTVSKRSGIHQYQFPKNSKQIIILDLEHRDEVLDSKILVTDENTIQGYRHSKAWATNQQLFYTIKFSKKIKNISYLNEKTEGKSVKAAFDMVYNVPIDSIVDFGKFIWKEKMGDAFTSKK